MRSSYQYVRCGLMLFWSIISSSKHVYSRHFMLCWGKNWLKEQKSIFCIYFFNELFFYATQAYADSDVDLFTWGTPITTLALFTILLHLGTETKTWVRNLIIKPTDDSSDAWCLFKNKNNFKLIVSLLWMVTAL